MAVTNHQNSQTNAKAEHDKAVFFLRMIRIKKRHRIFIKKNCLGFLKRNTVLTLVLYVLMRIPFEIQP